MDKGELADIYGDAFELLHNEPAILSPQFPEKLLKTFFDKVLDLIKRLKKNKDTPVNELELKYGSDKLRICCDFYVRAYITLFDGKYSTSTPENKYTLIAHGISFLKLLVAESETEFKKLK